MGLDCNGIMSSCRQGEGGWEHIRSWRDLIGYGEIGGKYVRHAKDKGRLQSAGKGKNVWNKRQNRSLGDSTAICEKGIFQEASVTGSDTRDPRVSGILQRQSHQNPGDFLMFSKIVQAVCGLMDDPEARRLTRAAGRLRRRPRRGRRDAAWAVAELWRR